MKEVNPLSIIHMVNKVAVSINDPHRILICFSTIGHKTLELWIRDVISCHYYIEILPGYQLYIYILGLHITTNNGHDMTAR